MTLESRMAHAKTQPTALGLHGYATVVIGK